MSPAFKRHTPMLAGLLCALASHACVLQAAPAGNAVAGVAATASLEPFPVAGSGERRHVIQLPVLTEGEAESLKVELLIGKVQAVDCNHQWYGGQLEAHTVQGWGYSYWRLPEVKGPASTLMGCLDAAPREAFVQVQLGAEAWQRYNSRLPLVVYVPEGFEVRYRLWRAEPEIRNAEAQ